MVRTAPPDALEQAHEEAFARLTPEQRRQVLAELTAITPDPERPPSGQDDPRTLARLATRAEMRESGSVERALSRGGPGRAGGLFGGSLLVPFAMGFLGSMAFSGFFGESGSDAAAADSEASGERDGEADDESGHSFADGEGQTGGEDSGEGAFDDPRGGEEAGDFGEVLDGGDFEGDDFGGMDFDAF
jgi:hypothetical protein